MKLTTKKLKELIKEEIERVFEEEDPLSGKYDTVVPDKQPDPLSGDKDTVVPDKPPDPLSGDKATRTPDNPQGLVMYDRVVRLEKIVKQLIAAIKK